MADDQHELDQHFAELEQRPDPGVAARHTARAQLVTEHQSRTRLAIARRAVRLIHGCLE